MEIIIDCIIGIDPGMSGGMAVWRPNDLAKTHKMPREIKLFDEFLKYQKSINGYILVIIEKVQPFWSDSKEENKGKQFRIQQMLGNYAQLKAVLETNSIPYIPISPITWQTYLRIRKKKEEKQVRKNRFKNIAQNQFPEIKVTLWNCDALLLVQFGRMKRKLDPGWIKERLPNNALQKLI